MAKNYTIDKKAKKIKADIEKLTEKELEVLKKYIVLGYEVEDVPAEKKFELTQAFIKNYLEENDAEKLEEFEEKIKGKGKFNSGKFWFMTNYPAGNTAMEKITKERKVEAMEKAFLDYQKKKEKELEAFEKNNDPEKKAPADTMKKDEFIRYYYWKNIYTK